MDTNTVVFLAILTIFSLGYGISGFIGNRAEGYSLLSFSGRLLFLGIFTAAMLLVGLMPFPLEKEGYIISYIFLFFGAAFFLSAIGVMGSRRASNFWWRLVRRNEQSTDRVHLVLVLFVLSFGFFFGFFLLYPPFLSIG